MAYIAATNCTVSVLDKGVVGKKRRTYGTIVFDSTTLTYTATTGIPLPTFGKWGFMKQVDMIFFNQSVAATVGGLVYKYDKTNHSIRVFCSAAITPAGTIAAPVFTGIAKTVAGTVSAPVFTADGFTEATLGTTHTITGTVSAPVFTSTPITVAGTINAPTFTGTAGAIAGLAEWTNNVALGASVTLYFDAIGV
jgi:hypothetical protein